MTDSDMRKKRPNSIGAEADETETGERGLSPPESWLDRHGDALYRFACFRLHDTAVAEDLVQETLLAAFRARAGFAGRSSERTWLVGILKNKIIDHLRKRWREEPVDLALEPDEALEALFSPGRTDHWTVAPSLWQNPTAALEQKQFWEIFSTCVDHLPTRQAQAFVLCELDGLDGAEICQVLGVTATNLWVLLHRARLRLRGCLEQNWFQGGEEVNSADV